jgi:hypothetical protein
LSLENSAKSAEDPSAAVPLDESEQGTAGAVAGKTETKEERAVNALRKAQGKKVQHSAAQRFLVKQ